METRLEKKSGRTFGTLEGGFGLDAIIRRASLGQVTASGRRTVQGRGQLARSLYEVTQRAVEAGGLVQYRGDAPPVK